MLCKYQFGYVKNSNCETAVLHVMNQIYKNIENKSLTSILFIDLSKAFDSLYHPLLLTKLKKMQFSENFLNLINSYLSNRKQYVEINGKKSSTKYITTGVFQGSKLAAIIFIIYVNSIFNLPINGKIIMYADDIAIIYNAIEVTDLKNKMEYDLKVLEIWFENHFLKMNTKKTNYIFFKGRAKLDYFTQTSFTIKLNDQLIERVSDFKYLGFWIDEELKFNRHIEHIKSKIIPMTYAIKRIRSFIEQRTALQLYFAHIYSHLLYMSPFWSVASDNLINSVAVVQRKCLRFVFNKYSYSLSRELFSEHILPLKQLNKYNSLVLAFKLSKNMIINNVDLISVQNLHDHNTRQRNHYYVETYNSRFGYANFFTSGIISYNELSQRIKNLQSIGRFKRELKILLIDEYLSNEN